MVKQIFSLMMLLFISLICHANEREAFIKTSLSDHMPYPFQQIIYSVKIYTRYPLVRVSMQPPTVEGKDLTQLGSVQQYQSTEQGQNYYVAKVDYLFFSKNSGQRIIEPPLMNGLVNAGNDPYSPYNLQNVSAKGDPQSFDVKPIPATFTGDLWLPTTKLTVTDDWSKDLSKVKVGESVTRTVILHALGVMESQLPDIKFPDVPGVNIYPDKPETKLMVTQNGVAATKIFKFAVVPTQAGSHKIPSINLPWWNTQKRKMESSVVPGVAITVIGGVVPLESNQPAMSPKPELVATKIVTQTKNYPLWMWILGGLFMFSGWMVAFVLYLQRVVSFNQQTCEPDPKLRVMMSALKHACNSNNPDEAYSLATQIASKNFPTQNILNLSQLADWVNDEALKQQINALNQIKYHGSDMSTWDGKAFFAAFKCACQHSEQKNSVGPQGLPPLFQSH